MKFQCTKGMADAEDLNVFVMQQDVVEVTTVEEGFVHVIGIAGWCNGVELSFTPKQFTEHSATLGITYTIWDSDKKL